MSLIDEALRRAQSARPPPENGPASPDPFQAAPLPDPRRSSRRARHMAVPAVVVLLLAGGAALLRARRDRGSEPPRNPRSSVALEQPPPAGFPTRSEQAVAIPSPERSAVERRPSPHAGAVLEPPTTTALPSVTARPARPSDVSKSAGSPEPIPLTPPASSSPRIDVSVARPSVSPTRSQPEAVRESSDRRGAVHNREAIVPGGKIELGGIVYSENNPVALLNGRVVGIGAVVEGFTVVAIEENRVELKNDHRTIVLTLH